MPAPPNMRRTVTDPKAANNSRMSSGPTAAPRPCARLRALLLSLGRRLELHRFAAPAGPGLVGIVEHELGGELLGLVVHLGAQEEQDRLGVDQHAYALVLDQLVGRLDLLGVFHRIGHAGAAAVLDAD